MSLRKSASLPGLLKGCTGAAAGSPSPKLCRDTLLVGQPPNSDGRAAWEPFHVQHLRDGKITMRSASPDSGLGASQTMPRAGHDGIDHLLDADWRKPFVVKPGKPLRYSEGPLPAKMYLGQSSPVRRDLTQLPPDRSHPGNLPKCLLPPGSHSADATTKPTSASSATAADLTRGDKEIYPFEIVYAPSPAMLGEPDGAAPLRRTVLLAAQNVAARDRWLSSLTRKGFSPLIRSRSDLSGAGSGQLVSFGDGKRHPSSSSWTSLRPPGASPAPPRLNPVGNGTGLWDASSKLHIVRELYDSYAADPLGEFDLRRGRHVASSPEAKPSRELLERYVDRQQVIEELLMQRSNNSRLDLHQPVPEAEPDDSDGLCFMTEPEDTFRKPLPLISKSPNVDLQGSVMQNDEWGGGVLLNPKNPRRWSLTILPEDVDVIPIFIGIAPAELELSMVNFFDPRAGIFLCMGGQNATAALTASMGASGGPIFHVLGERSPAHLPVPARGKSITVSYSEDVPEGKTVPVGQVLFSVEGESPGEGAYIGRPRLKKKLPLGVWKPCIYLCLPKTRLTVTQFS